VFSVSPQAVLQRLSSLGVNNYTRAEAKSVFTSLYQASENENRYYFFAVNNGADAVATHIEIDSSLFKNAAEWMVLDLERSVDRVMGNSDLRYFPVELPAREGVVYRIEPRRGGKQ
jgi:hypothetical protein